MFLKSSDADLFVTAFGSGPRTLVAHGGWVGSGELWLQPFEQLSRRWRCITYDHRGSGSTIHRGGPLTPALLLDDLFRVLDACGVERCVLAGESAGALTVLQAVQRAPDRFSGVLLVGPRTSTQRTERSVRLAAGCRQDFEATMDAFVTACTPEDGVEAERAWGKRIVMRSSGEQAAQLLENYEQVDLEALLESVRVPTLVLHGELDAIAPMEGSQWLVSRIPGARLVRMADTGHVPTVTRPAAVVQEIERFFG